MQRESREVNPGTDNPLIVIGVDAHRVGLEVESVLAVLDMLELVLMKIWPSPDSSVDDVGEAFPPGNLHLKKNVCTVSSAMHLE